VSSGESPSLREQPFDFIDGSEMPVAAATRFAAALVSTIVTAGPAH
jgi:hypothetical protein